MTWEEGGVKNLKKSRMSFMNSPLCCFLNVPTSEIDRERRRNFPWLIIKRWSYTGNYKIWLPLLTLALRIISHILTTRWLVWGLLSQNHSGLILFRLFSQYLDKPFETGHLTQQSGPLIYVRFMISRPHVWRIYTFCFTMTITTTK